MKSRKEIEADPDLCLLLENPYIKDNMEMAVLARNLKTAEFPYREPLERLVFWGNSGIAERDSRATAGNSQFDTMYNELVEQSEGLYITVSE